MMCFFIFYFHIYNKKFYKKSKIVHQLLHNLPFSGGKFHLVVTLNTTFFDLPNTFITHKEKYPKIYIHKNGENTISENKLIIIVI